MNAFHASPFIIAEIGVNHDGSVDRALDLVSIAARCGADAVKLQIFRGRRLMNSRARLATYQQGRVATDDPVEMLEQYELAEPALAQIAAAIRSAGMIPLATPFSPEDVGVIRRLDLPLIKLASPDLVNKPLLLKAAAVGKPLLLSTGASTLGEISTTLSWLPDFQTAGSAFPPITLLHCISSYPTPPAQTHLSWIPQLAQQFNLPVGYSDHSTEILAGPLAVAAGAILLERHLTYDKSAQGPDHSASSDPADFAEYVRLSRLAAILRGNTGKQVLSIEQDVRSVSRQSLVTARSLPAGHQLTADDLTTQRPGTGIPASQIDNIIGQVLTRAYAAYEMLDPQSLRR